MKRKKLFPLIFLDIDGVLNCQLHYRESDLSRVTEKVNKAYFLTQLSGERVRWLNELCAETGAKVVISSSWRLGYGVPKLRQILRWAGATFEVLGATPFQNHVARGQEVKWWLETHVEPLFGVFAHGFKLYAIVDDDSDMLLSQREQFFQTDGYSGLTPTTCYKIKRYFETFTHNAWTPPRPKKKKK